MFRTAYIVDVYNEYYILKDNRLIIPKEITILEANDILFYNGENYIISDITLPFLFIISEKNNIHTYIHIINVFNELKKSIINKKRKLEINDILNA